MSGDIIVGQYLLFHLPDVTGRTFGLKLVVEIKSLAVHLGAFHVE